MEGGEGFRGVGGLGVSSTVGPKSLFIGQSCRWCHHLLFIGQSCRWCHRLQPVLTSGATTSPAVPPPVHCFDVGLASIFFLVCNKQIFLPSFLISKITIIV